VKLVSGRIHPLRVSERVSERVNSRRGRGRCPQTGR
jgi:hypothetical protein